MTRETQWDEREPIYRQLRDRIAALILERGAPEGTPLPSVRSIAEDFQINPLTVLKSYQALVDEGIVEKRRGLGMYLARGGQERLLENERKRFLEQDWPDLIATIRRLGLDPEALCHSLTNHLERRD